MLFKRFLFIFLFFLINIPLFAQGSEQGNHSDVIRGEVFVDFEPIYAGHVDGDYPLDTQTAGRRALEEAALFFSAMIYGWSFYYEAGERARQISENLELSPVSEIQFGDPALRVTETQIRDMSLWVWADYHLSDAQRSRMRMWRTGNFRNAQAVGHSPSFIEEYPGWLIYKKMALEDAARAAIRAMLRSTERNRPKEATGFISLASFPRYYIDEGRWTASARFRVQINEIIPFAAY